MQMCQVTRSAWDACLVLCLHQYWSTKTDAILENIAVYSELGWTFWPNPIVKVIHIYPNKRFCIGKKSWNILTASLRPKSVDLYKICVIWAPTEYLESTPKAKRTHKHCVGIKLWNVYISCSQYQSGFYYFIIQQYMVRNILSLIYYLLLFTNWFVFVDCILYCQLNQYDLLAWILKCPASYC